MDVAITCEAHVYDAIHAIRRSGIPGWAGPVLYAQLGYYL